MSVGKNKLLQKLKEYFIKKYNITLTDEELEEVYQSFFHLGTALYIFANQKGDSNEPKSA